MDVQQKWAALVISLIVLLILTLLSVTTLQTVSMEERMAGNMRNKNLAFQAAETALRAGEKYLSNATLDPFDGTTPGLYQPSLCLEPCWEEVNWSDFSKIKAYNGTLDGGDLNDLASPPAYIIEEVSVDATSGGTLEAGTPKEGKLYRVSSRGVGGTDRAVVMVQSVYRR